MDSRGEDGSAFGPMVRRAFFARDALVVARSLLGAVLVHGDVALRITETEAYRSQGDSANHCRFGRTERNAPMWGPPGCAYVYLCYGMHHLLNVVTGDEGVGEAVLIRSAEPLGGLAAIRARRGARDGAALLAGPAKVAQALAIDRTFNGHVLTRRGGLEVRRGVAPSRVLAGPRVGIDYATREDREAPWRFAIADSPWVSVRRTLTPVS